MSTRLLLAIIATVTVIAAPAAAQTSPDIIVPDAPANLTVPVGNEVFMLGRATGTQNYMCLPSSTGIRWVFLAPQATLHVPIFGDLQQQLTTHFLSPNPDEKGAARATWQHSFDSSQVWARAIASSADANFVAPNSIPWLLLEVVGSEAGPSGGSLLTRTTYVQRLNTLGGVAPSAGCSQSGEVGALAMVPYTTDYFFYRSSRHR